MLRQSPHVGVYRRSKELMLMAMCTVKAGSGLGSSV